MHRESSNVESNAREARLNRRRRDALEVLFEARDRLISQLAEEVEANREVLLDRSGESLFSFEFQEIEDRYSARLHALNSILENLEYRRPRLAHRIETVRTTADALKEDVNALLEEYDQWDLIDLAVTPVGEELLVTLAFTADEYAD